LGIYARHLCDVLAAMLKIEIIKYLTKLSLYKGHNGNLSWFYI